MKRELREKFNAKEKSELIVTENGTILMAYFEDVLEEADDLVKEVFKLFSKYSSTTDKEMEDIHNEYESMFKKTKWTFVEVPLIDE